MPVPKLRCTLLVDDDTTTNYLNVHAVREYKDEQGNKRSHWTKIGAAFPNSKGGFSIKLDFIPVGPGFDTIGGLVTPLAKAGLRFLVERTH